MSLYEQLLDLLRENPLVKEHWTVERKIVDQETFSFKIRARITETLTLQIRYLQDGGFVRCEESVTL